ncbi:hypothetical protein CP970_40695 [Streptomyces kanamyceticus]|uniref:Uncharacterized protein n=1 Tax=Streptomyces kanamyceticus TaxID=1967 RepID=A0A5J6GTQ8_STRKN|nr:hypothetical protein CP970_40695 [Streptomyces kanamyceticus]
MEHVPRGGISADAWAAQFLRAAEENLRSQLSTEADQGTLHELALDHREGGVWATATFSMAARPGVRFIRSQNIIPGLSADWEADFAATLFETHLIEWFHTRAKEMLPDSDGVVRS